MKYITVQIVNKGHIHCSMLEWLNENYCDLECNIIGLFNYQYGNNTIHLDTAFGEVFVLLTGTLIVDFVILDTFNTFCRLLHIYSELCDEV